MLDNFKKFKEKLLEQFSNLEIGLAYRKDSDTYEIWHDSFEYEKNEYFKEKVGEALYEEFYEKNIFNFFFNLSHERANERLIRNAEKAMIKSREVVSHFVRETISSEWVQIKEENLTFSSLVPKNDTFSFFSSVESKKTNKSSNMSLLLGSCEEINNQYKLSA